MDYVIIGSVETLAVDRDGTGWLTAPMRVTEVVSRPYTVEITKDDDRIVEIVVRSVGDEGELTFVEIRKALQDLGDRLRPFAMRSRMSPSGDDEAMLGGRRLRDVINSPETTESLLAMALAFQQGGSRVNEPYLARLAVAYSELAKDRRDAATHIARILRKPAPTVKGHIMRARREGLLGPTEPGREGGAPTQKALDVIAQNPMNNPAELSGSDPEGDDLGTEPAED